MTISASCVSFLVDEPDGTTTRARRVGVMSAGRWLGTALLGATLLSAAPAGASAFDAATRPLTVAMSTDVATLDPSKSSEANDLNIFKQVFSALTEIGADGAVVPNLAESWTTADNITWDFTLREGMKFHNGDPVSASDVVWTFKKLAEDTASPVRVRVSSVISVEALDARTVRIVNRIPFAPFPRQMSLISILPEKAYTEIGPQEFAQHPVGSGRYKVMEWTRSERLVLEAVPDHPQGTPKIKTVIYRPIPSVPARVAALEAGEIDIAPVIPEQDKDRIDALPDLRVERVSSNRVTYVGFNLQTGPVDDVKLRQAIDFAIDRDAIAEHLLGGLGIPVGQPVTPAVEGFDPAIEPTPYDPERARQLVAESAYDGSPILLQYATNGNAGQAPVAEAVAGFLGEVGINVKMESMEYSALFSKWATKSLAQIHVFAYGPSIMDADLPVDTALNAANRGYWDDPKLRQLIEQERATTDQTARRAVFSEIFRMAKQAVPIAPLYAEIQLYGVREGIDWAPRADERLVFVDAAYRD